MVSSVDDLFVFLFLSAQLQKYKEKVVKIFVPRDSETSFTQDHALVLGSQLDRFLRRCLIASGQMMFENIIWLYQNYRLFCEGKPYEYHHSTVQLENWVDSKVRSLEDDLMLKNWRATDIQFALESGFVAGQLASTAVR